MNKLLCLTLISLSTTLPILAENPSVLTSILTAVDSKNTNRTATTAAGQSLVMVAYRDGYDTTAPRKSTIKFSPVPTEAGYPKWFGDNLLNPQNGATSVLYSGTSDSTVIGISPADSVSIGIDIVDEARAETVIDLDKYKALLEKINTALDLIAKRVDGVNPVTASGKITYKTSKTDMYAQGTQIGISSGLSVDFSLKLAALEAKSKDMPTPWPGLSIAIGASTTGFQLKGKGDIKYDQQYSNPWVASKVKLTAGTSVGINATATLGPNFGGSASGLAINGEAVFTIAVSGEIKGEGNKITASASAEIGSLTLNYGVSVKLDVWGVNASYELYRDSTVISKGETANMEPYTIAQW